MPVITPNIPEGLIELMKTFAKCVLKEKPENIYEFSVVHFENLLQERDGDLNKGYERFAASEKYIEAREKCLMSQITSHLNRKMRPDPIKIPPYDEAEDISLSETLSPKSLQHKFRPRKLSSRKASEALLSIREEDEGHNPSEELAVQHGKLTAARKIQKAYKSYRKRKEERENSAALVIQRTLKKLFGNKLEGVKTVHNDGESTCSNLQNDSGVESDVPKEETEGEQENHKELNVGAKKYLDCNLAINPIITQQDPSFTEDECISQNLEADKVEKPSVGNLVETDTVAQKEKSVDGEPLVHSDSNIGSSAYKQIDIKETQLKDESEQRTQDIAEVDAANLNLDHNLTIDEVVKAEILKDVEEPLKNDAADPGKSILEKEGRFFSNDTNNIGSAELVSDVQYKKSDDIENKGNGFSEAILEDVARNGSKNDISKETIELIKSPRENEDSKKNLGGDIKNEKKVDKIEIENDEKVINLINGHSNDQKQEEIEANSQNKNDITENQSQLNSTENETNSQGDKETEIESIMTDEVKIGDVHKINSDKHIDINGVKNGNEESKEGDSKLLLNKDEDAVSTKSVWYVGSEPIITSKLREENVEAKSLEKISTISKENSELDKIAQENNSTINENSKTDLVNEKIESNGNDSNQESQNNIKNENDVESRKIEINNTENENEQNKISSKEVESEAEAENIEISNTGNEDEHSEILPNEVESDNNAVDEGEIIIKKHADEVNSAIPEITESSADKLENDEEQEDIARDNNVVESSELKQGEESEKDQIILEATETDVENFKNEGEKGEEIPESSVEKRINDEEQENIIESDKTVADEDSIGVQNEKISVSKQIENDEENQTISETGRNIENLKNEQEISEDTGSDDYFINTGESEIQSEEISGSKTNESFEGEKHKSITETNENFIEDIKNNEENEEKSGTAVANDNNSAEKDEISIHNKEIISSGADDGDKSNNIPKTTEDNTDILRNGEEKEETVDKKSSKEVIESKNVPIIEKASEEVLNISEGEKNVDNNESHIIQDNLNNIEELENEGETEKYNGKENEENASNNKVVDEENLPLGENKNEEEVGNQNKASKVFSEDDEDGINNNQVEVIEEEIKKVVAPPRYTSPGKIVKINNPIDKCEDLEALEDKIIAKELLQHANVNDGQNKQQIAHDEADDAKTMELKLKLTDSNSEGLENNHLKDDGTFDSKSIEPNTSNENNKSDEDKDELKGPITSKRNSEAEIKKLEIKTLNSESRKEELNATKEVTNGSTQMEKNEKPKVDLTEDKERKKKEEGAFEGFILEPAFKDNDGGNTGIDPEEENVKKDSIEDNEVATVSEQQEDIPELKASQSQSTEVPKDDKQNDLKSENEPSQDDDDKVGIRKKEDLTTDDKNEDKIENNLFLTQTEKQQENDNLVGSVEENENTINNSENTDKNQLINKTNNINQEQEKDVNDVKQTALQKDLEKIVRVESAENNDVKNESDLEISRDTKNLETSEAGSSTPDNLNDKDNQNDEANISQQIKENSSPQENIDDIESKKKEELAIDHKLPVEESLKVEEKENSLKDDEYNFENIKEIVNIQNEENEKKTIERTELEPVDEIELEKLNTDQTSENISEGMDNIEDKEISDEEDTEFSQDTVEETPLSELVKSTSKENSKQNLDVKVENKDGEKDIKTENRLKKPLEETEINENSLTKIDNKGNIYVDNSEELTQDNKNNSSEPSQQNVENYINETGRGIEVEKHIGNHEVGSNLEETKNVDNHNKELSQSKTTNEVEINQTGTVSAKSPEIQIDETSIDLDDLDKSSKTKVVLESGGDTNKSTELEKEENVEDKNITKNDKQENLNSSDHENKNLEKNSSFSDNNIKEVEKEDINNSKNGEDEGTSNEGKEQTDNAQLNRTYTISKNNPEETPDYNKENHIHKRHISSSSSLVNILSNETSTDNEFLSQTSTEKSQGEEMVEVQEEPTVKQIISETENSKVQSAHLSDIEINREQQNALNGQSNETAAKNEDPTEKFESEEIKAEINEEPTARQFITTSEIHSAPLSDAETTRVESRSTINDELSEIENIDISTYGEDSLEAMYYSLRKNEIMLDRMQKRASERKSATKERGPIEKLDLRQVKSMSEMGRSMSIYSDDDVVIKTLERNKSSDNDLQQFNNPISIVAQNAAKLLESMHQINSNPARPLSSSFEEERVVRQPCRIYSPSIRMKSRIPTPIKDFPKSVSFETPLAVAQRKSQKFMQRLHNDTQSPETVDSLLNQKETSDTIRQKMLAYSVSEADSDYCVEAEKKMSVKHDDSNVSTALETASTDTDSTIVSAATKIQAGARGFLTRRRLRRASDGALPQESERKASFGNEAIGESLEDLIEQNAASKIQKSYRRYLGCKQHKSESSKPSPETSSSSKSSDGSKPVGITQVKIGQKRDRDDTDDANKVDDIDDGYHGAYFEGLNLAERRMTLQRGDAVQKYSTPEEENGFSLTNCQQLSDTGDSKSATSPKTKKSVKNHIWRNFGLRQRTMPVQIESDILRIVPKHMRKRIKSADAQKNNRKFMQ